MTTSPLTGKTALVTGAETGIGRDIAKTLAAQGAQVAINHPHIPEAAADVVREIERRGGTAVALAADIGDRDEYEELVEALLETYGHWDLLVHSGAVTLTEPPTGDDLSEAAKSVANGLELAWRHMADGGKVVTVSAEPDATERALEQFTGTLTQEYGARPITLDTVRADAERTGTPGEIASVLAFLTGDPKDGPGTSHATVPGETVPALPTPDPATSSDADEGEVVILTPTASTNNPPLTRGNGGTVI
ncbi:SDR family NAD(P)-dependent oxidoreductase [Nocardia sp. NPDC052566]|uniref:SDR family NAD(P)-dependent oxidoreductase n=1 Tax=Nocardia sp. NPDC052566 TaxID=3364330 RepID=UPI0037C89410